MSSTNAGTSAGTSTEVALQARPIHAASEALNKALASVRAVLPAHITAERMTKLSLGVLRTNKELFKAAKENPDSFVSAVLSASRLGLEPGFDAHLVPYNNSQSGKPEIQMIPDYRGLMALARRSGYITSIQVEIVYENDEFDLSFGLEQKLVHKPCLRGSRGNAILVYGVARFTDGTHHIEWMTKEAVDKIRDQSKAYKSAVRYKKDTPWISHYEEMMRKTLVRRITKFLPRSVELQMAEKFIDAEDTGRKASLENIDGEYFVVEDEGSGQQEDDGQQEVRDQTAPATNQSATAAAKERLRAAREQKTEPPPQHTAQGSIDAEKRTTHDELADKLRKAGSVDDLDEVADLIRQVPDDYSKSDLRAIYKSRREELLAG